MIHVSDCLAMSVPASLLSIPRMKFTQEITVKVLLAAIEKIAAKCKVVVQPVSMMRHRLTLVV